MRTRSRHIHGLTLVEVALLLSLLGVVLAVGVPAFVRGLRTSKTAEAPHELTRMFDALSDYYGTPQPTPSGKRLRCLPEAAGPTPETPSTEPVVVEFGAGDGPDARTWRAIGYEPSGPVRFRYSLVPVKPGCGAHPLDSEGRVVVTLRAEGDLDGDGTFSRFERRAVTKDGALILEPVLVVHDRVE